MSTAAPLCTFLRIRNRAKTQNTNFVQKSFNPNAQFLILFIFSLFIFFIFSLSIFWIYLFSIFLFLFFYFFLDFFFYFFYFPFFYFFFWNLFLPPHEGVYLIFTTRGCLLDWSYLGVCFIGFTTLMANQRGFYSLLIVTPTWVPTWLVLQSKWPVKKVFIFVIITPYLGAYLIGLTIQMANQRGFFLFNHHPLLGCLLDWSYNPKWPIK